MYLERENIHGTKEGQGIRITTLPCSKEVGDSPAPTLGVLTRRQSYTVVTYKQRSVPCRFLGSQFSLCEALQT